LPLSLPNQRSESGSRRLLRPAAPVPPAARVRREECLRRTLRAEPDGPAPSREPADRPLGVAVRAFGRGAISGTRGGPRPLAGSSWRGRETALRPQGPRARLGWSGSAPVGADGAVRGGHSSPRRRRIALPLLLYAGGDPGRSIRAARHPGLDRYPGTCRELTTAQRAVREASRRPPALRVRSDDARVAFEDRLLGRCEEEVDDFVVRRNDGTPADQLAVVVDDGAQGIREVVRSADLADSTPRQILLARLLACRSPDTPTSPSCSARPDGVSPNATAPSPSPTAPLWEKARTKYAPGWPAHSASPGRPLHPTISSPDPLRLPREPTVWSPETAVSKPHSMVPFLCNIAMVSDSRQETGS
jgi:tRNA synthetases class I (E and Q), catalytic domain